MDAEDRIIRAKIKLGSFKEGKPFFASLLYHLKISEDKKSNPSICVNAKGDCKYNKEWIESLNPEEVSGVLVHEVMHLALSHLFRKGERDAMLWNIAGDIYINNVLVENDFSLPACGLIPSNDEIELNISQNKTYTLKNISRKSCEEIYDEMYKVAPKIKRNMVGIGKSGGSNSGFDGHGYGSGKPKDKKGNSNGGKSGEDKWKDILVQSSNMAKMQGNVPAGMDRIIDSLVNNKVNWKTLLRKYITNEIMSDYSWSRPNKRSRVLGTYLPSAVKENVELVVAVDTSGSIGQEELTQFVSEIVHIVKSTNNLKAKVWECDCEIHQELEVKNGNVKKILNMEVKGGGGTSHIPVFNKMEQEKAKVLINLTDGYTNFPEKKYGFDTIWVLTKGGCNEKDVPFGKVIRMD